MRAVSDAWLRTVVGSHTPQYRATLCTEYQTTNAPTGARVPIIDGSVVLDGAADVRGSLDMTVPGSYWPVQLRNADLAPQGSEMYVEVGIRFSDDLIEWLGLGYFRIKTIGQDNPERVGPIRLTGQDRMAGIVRAKLLSPHRFRATDTIGGLVNALVTEVFTDAVIVWDDDTDDRELGRDIIVDSDRYAALASVAQSYGKVMYWNASGELAFVAVPDSSTSVAELLAGRGGVLLGAPRQLSDEGVVNAVVARGDAADETGGAYGVAIDSDPDSPTSYRSRFGPSPLFVTNSLITTDAQALSAASSELQLHSGIPYTTSFLVSPRPELEPYDAVTIDHKGLASRERHVLSSVTIPLRAGQPMPLNTRQQSILIVGSSAS